MDRTKYDWSRQSHDHKFVNDLQHVYSHEFVYKYPEFWIN